MTDFIPQNKQNVVRDLSDITERFVQIVIEYFSKNIGVSIPLDTTLLYGSISSNLLGLLASITQVIVETEKHRILSWTNVCTQLVSTVLSFASIFYRGTTFKLPYEKISFLKKTLISVFVNNPLDIIFPNAECSITFDIIAKYAVSLISLGLGFLFGMSGLDNKKLKDIFFMHRGIKEMAKDIKEYIICIFEDLGIYLRNIDRTLEMEAAELLSRSTSVLTVPVSTLVLNSSMRGELELIIEGIARFIRRPLSEEQSKCFNSTKALLNNQYLKLQELRKTLSTVVSPSSRVTCTGFVLEGSPGVGKSTFGEYLLQKLAKDFGWNSKIYNVSTGVKGEYSQIYHQEELGILNEFAALRDEDPMLPSLNGMISGDPFNMEAAHVEFKHQPCNLKAMCLTANDPTYDFMRTISEQANLALVSRLHRFKVTDPCFQGRADLNPHRTIGNFSHLKLFRWIPRTNVPKKMMDAKQGTWVQISENELLAFLRWRCAIETKNWLLKTLEKAEAADESVLDALRAQLENIERVIECNQELAQSCKERVTTVVTPNAGQSYFTYRIEGKPGTGKTARINKLARELNVHTKYPIMTIDNKTDFQATLRYLTAPHIILFDDFDFKSRESEVLEFMNKAYPGNIYLIATHYESKTYPIPWYSLAVLIAILKIFFENLTRPAVALEYILRTLESRKYIIDVRHEPQLIYEELGLYRRLGFCGLVRTPNGEVDCTNVPTIQSNSLGSMLSNLRLEGEYETERLINAHKRYVETQQVIVTKYETAPIFEPDVTMEVKDWAALVEIINSNVEKASMLNNPRHPVANIRISLEAMDKIAKSNSVYGFLNINALPSDQRAAATYFSHQCRSINPFLKFTIKTPTTLFSYTDNTLYIQELYKVEDLNIDEGVLYHKGNPVPFKVVQFMVYGVEAYTDPDLSSYTALDLVKISRFLSNSWNELPSYYEAWQREQYHKEQVLAAKNNPALRWLSTPMGKKWKLVVSALAVAVGAFTAYKIFFPKKENNYLVFPNSPGKDNQRIRSRQYHYVNQVLSGKYNSPEQYAKDLLKAGVNPREVDDWYRYNDSTRNAMEKEAMPARELQNLVRQGKTELAETLFNKNGGITFSDFVMLCQASPNAVSVDMELNTKPSILEPIINRLKKALVTVHSNMNCYGIALGDRTVVTVLHALDVDKPVLVKTNLNGVPTSFEAKVRSTSKTKDLAILEVTDKLWPTTKRLFKFLPDVSTRADWVQKCYYIRPVEQTFVAIGEARYEKRSKNPLVSLLMQNYSPNDYIMFDAFTQLNVNDIYKIGDCGMPLVAVSGNKCYIVGIHNAYSQSGTAWFSPIYKEEIALMNVQSVRPNATDLKLEITQIEALAEEKAVSVPNYNVYLDQVQDHKWHDHPEIPVLGYFPQMHLWSKPKFSKAYIRHPECLLDTDMRPSPIRLSDLSETALSSLPKNDVGIASPLLAQTKKFFAPSTFCPDNDVVEWAIDICQQEFAALYSKTQPLRWHQVINGKQDGPLTKVTLDTSCGPYMKLKYKLANKRQLFKEVVHENGNTALITSEHPAALEMRDHYEQICELWENGQQIAIFVKDNPKVELLPMEDVTEGKVRLFCEMDVAVNLAFKRYFGDISNEIHKGHISGACKIGHNPYVMPTYLMKYVGSDWVQFGTDLKRMDKGLKPYLLDVFSKIIESTTTDPTHQRAIRTAIASLHQTIHIQDGVLYLVEGGNPSGIYITTLINTVIRHFGAIYCYIQKVMAFPNCHRYLSFAAFKHYTVQADLGDDEYFASDPAINITFQDSYNAWRQLGLELVQSKNFQEPDFCSRRLIVSDDAIVYPCLKKSSITGTLFYIDRSNMSSVPLMFSHLIFEASLWDEEFFNQVVHDVRLQCKRLRIDTSSVNFPNYKKQRTHFAQYVLGQVKSPVLGIGEQEINWLLYDEYDMRDRIDASITDYCKEYMQYCFNNADKPQINSKSSYHRGTSLWKCTITDRGHKAEGVADNEDAARNEAYKILLNNRISATSNENKDVSE